MDVLLCSRISSHILLFMPGFPLTPAQMKTKLQGSAGASSRSSRERRGQGTTESSLLKRSLCRQAEAGGSVVVQRVLEVTRVLCLDALNR